MCLLEVQPISSQDLLLPKYEKGIAILKSGIKMEGQFNYSTLNRQIQYLGKEDAAMTFEKPEDLASVAIAGRIFENTSNGILERVSVGEGFYYVEWSAKWISVGKLVGNGHRAQSYSTTNYKALDTGTSSSPQYTHDEGMVTIPECYYYIKKNNHFKRFNSASSLSKAIGCCKNELKAFVKKENIRFNNPEDVYRMMQTFLSEAANP
jgi:hypothetical protein